MYYTSLIFARRGFKMKRNENLKKLEEIFSTVLEREITLKEGDGVLDIEGWDSLSHLILVSLIEEQFKVKFALGEQQEMHSIVNILDLIEEKTNAF